MRAGGGARASALPEGALLVWRDGLSEGSPVAVLDGLLLHWPPPRSLSGDQCCVPSGKLVCPLVGMRVHPDGQELASSFKEISDERPDRSAS